MNIDERHRAILELVNKNGSISTSEIQRRFMVGYDSAKRDLRILEESGLLKRTHGVAIALGSAGDMRMNAQAVRENSGLSDDCIGVMKYAISLVGESETIYITPSAEGRWFAENLPDKPIRAFTNSVQIASVLMQKRQIEPVMIGGRLDERGNCFDGRAIELLRGLRFDKSFIISDGISEGFGASSGRLDEAVFLREVIKVSKKSIGLYPGGKVGIESTAAICEAGQLGCVITDQNANAEETAKLRRCCVLVQADDPEETGGKDKENAAG